jgi:two-component system response regulator HydG
MATFPLKTTAPGVSRSVDEQTQAPVLALVILWSVSQPHRVGEVALLPSFEKLFIGRGDEEIEKFAHFMRRRPGEPATDPHEDLLTGDSLSRRQLIVCATAVAVEIESIGRCEMLVNGEETKSASLKPGDTVMLTGELLLLCVRRQIELPHPGGFVPAFGEPDAAGIIGESAAAWRLRDELAVVACSSDHVMIQGPSGSGKDLAAKAIHQGSNRAKGPFVSRNVANITRTLIPSELFGNIKNYPNAGIPERDGVLGDADGGTLFLDEIGACSFETQTSLMRVLDCGEYERVGKGTTRRVDVRLVGATNRDDSAFMTDFLARFRTRVRIPPLRDRREDIPLLVRHWVLDRARKEPKEAARFIQTGPSGRPEPRVSSRLIDYLVRQPFPLNVRELHNLLVVATRASKRDVVKIPLPDLTAAETSPPPPAGAEEAQRPPERRSPSKPSKEEIAACFERVGGNLSQAAEALGMDRTTLRRWMKKYGIK